MDHETRAYREIAPGAAVAPAPTWVELEPYAVPATANPHFIANGVCALLDESQIDLCGEDRAWFKRRADLVTATGGAEIAAQVSISFDPTYERLEIHSVAVIRDGRRIEHASAAPFEVLRRERNLERLQFDGHVTLHATLPDVRPGDVVEHAYTVHGMRKSLGGRHTAWLAFEWKVGIIDVRVRQRAPQHRAVHERAFCNPPQATQTEADGVIDRRWRSIERRGVNIEPLSPPWTLQTAMVQLSEWANWSEVAANFAPLYEDAGSLPEEIEAEIARIAATEPTLAGRAAAALRFVQNEVRYLAISMGEGGYTPRAIDAICATRYGDCKDKSKLLTAMARKLGVKACPALVNTHNSYALNGWLPSAQAFDHCIVRLDIDGAIYWVDPTRASQLSPLEKLNPCHFGWALPLDADVRDLERMPPPTPAHTMETRERLTLGPSPDHAVRYEYQTTWRRGRAEWLRENIARQGAVGLFKTYADDIGRRYAKAHPVRQEVTSDAPDTNEINTREVFEISGAWIEAGGTIRQFASHDITMRTQLAPLDAGAMKHPIYLGQVGQVTRNLLIETEFDINFPEWTRAIESSSLTFRSNLRRESSRRFVLEQSLDFLALTLPAGEADKYRAIIAELDQSDIVVSGAVSRKGNFIGSKEHADEMNESRNIAGINWALVWGALLAGYWVWRATGGEFSLP